MKLATRLDGLPLALATAGTYLSQTSDSFDEYLRLYEDSWDDLEQNSEELLEYEDRQLYTTWNLSLKQVHAQDAEAAALLRLLAYLDNQDIWYDLLRRGAEAGPSWFSDVVRNKPRFNRAMAKLHDYSLIEVQTSSYGLHTCVHDWVLNFLNRGLDIDLYRLAVRCVARNVMAESEAEFWAVNRRLLPHANRIEFNRLKALMYQSEVDAQDLHSIAYLYTKQGKMVEAEKMYLQALEGYEKAWGPEHPSTLKTVNNLGILYRNQGKMVEAEKMSLRALEGYEKAWGPEHTWTLDTVNNLGVLYKDQGKMVEAEKMYLRVLEGKEKAWGREYTWTLDTVNNLGNLDQDQGKIVEAEKMYLRALEGYEKAWGPEHTSMLDIVNNLGVLYKDQGKIVEAEKMYLRALRGYEKVFGPDHPTSQLVARNFSPMYNRQN
jgi:tetratricopeptide (TPR) repeat protein